MNKRLWALLAVFMLAAPSVSLAQNAGSSLVWVDLKARTTITSSTSPTYAEIGSPAGATNDGNYSRDSTVYTINTAGASAGGADTLHVMLPGWTPGPWRGATGVVADSMFAFVLSISPHTAATTTEGGDSIYVDIQSSGNGVDWVSFDGAATLGYGVPESGTANSWQFVFYTAGAARLVTNAAGTNSMFQPAVRVIVYGDASAANTGTFKAQAGYFRNVFAPTASP